MLSIVKRITVNVLLLCACSAIIAVLLLIFRADAAFNKAVTLEDAYRWKEAERCYKLAIRLNPFNSEYPAAYGDLQVRRGKNRRDAIIWLKDAESLYDKAMRLNPWYGAYALRRGEILIELYKKQKKYSKENSQDVSDSVSRAMDDFKQALTDDPKGFHISYSIGYIAVTVWDMLSKEDRELVMAKLRYALRLRPGYQRFVYPHIWRYTKDYNVLKKITPDTLDANESLYFFIKTNNLWQFRNKQEERVLRLTRRENMQKYKRDTAQKNDMIKKIRKGFEIIKYRPIDGERPTWIGNSDGGGVAFENGNMYWTGTMYTMVEIQNGVSAISIQAKGAQCDGIAPFMIVELDGNNIGETFVNNTVWEEYLFKVNSGEGSKVLSVRFVNDGGNQKTGEDRNLFVGNIGVEIAGNAL